MDSQTKLPWLAICILFVAFTLPAATKNEKKPAPAAPAPTGAWVDLLQQATAGNPAVVEAVVDLVRHPPGQNPVTVAPDPGLVVVTYRENNQHVSDVVVQLYQTPPDNVLPILNPHGTVRERLGDGLGDSADGLLNMLSGPSTFLGTPAEIQRQQRAFTATFNGDLTLLREQTVDPLHIIAVLPDAEPYLPASLSSRVNSILLSAELKFGRWRGTVGLITDDAEDAEQVGNIVAAWRDLANSLAQTYAGASSGQSLRESLLATTVEIIDNQVLTTAEIPAMTAVRVVKEAAGHGGGCPGGAPCPNNKVAVCHKDPGKPARQLCVAPAAVPAHLAHGDYCGPCLYDPPGNGGGSKGNNGVGNGEDPQPLGNPPVKDGPGTGPGNPGKGM